jgi:ATP-dependent RNA helicase MRH4
MDKISFIINYSKFGTRPPVFVAGTFSDPEWTPQEMQHTKGSDGELLFRAQIFVTPGKDYQYKFRLGEGHWWALDENRPVAVDTVGNQNNVLSVPPAPRRSSQVGFEKQLTPPVTPRKKATPPPPVHRSKRPNSPSADLAKDLEVQPDTEPSTAATSQARTHAAATADHVASLLDTDQEIPTPLKTVDIDLDEYNHEVDESLKTPLFAHESFGAYEFVDDGFDHVPVENSNQRRFSKSLKDCFMSNDLDLDDPTLEKFPSDRGSIFEALRKIQTTLDDDAVQADVVNSVPYDSSGRTSMDSADDLTLSPCSVSPTSTRRRDSRHSHSSVGRTKSAVSLGSIAEEDNPKGGTGRISIKQPQSTYRTATGPENEEDDQFLTISSAKKEPGKENSAQPRSMAKRSGKGRKAAREDSDQVHGSEERHGSYPKFITNVFEDSRTK